MEKAYKKRIADIILERRLQGKGTILIESPKWCGNDAINQAAKTLQKLAGRIDDTKPLNAFVNYTLDNQ